MTDQASPGNVPLSDPLGMEPERAVPAAWMWQTVESGTRVSLNEPADYEEPFNLEPLFRKAQLDAAVVAERDRYDELFAAYNEVCAISSRRAAAVDAIVSHWREFGPEHGLDEVIERAAAVVGRA